MTATLPTAEFDNYAENYDAGMDNPIKRMLGSDPSAFLRVKTDWMLADLRRRPLASTGPLSLLDYGCGHGLFLKVLADSGFTGNLCGADVSQAMLQEAERNWRDRAAPEFFLLSADWSPVDRFDIAILSAVMHHVLPAERSALYRRVYESLKPGGRLYVFEHNPWNPVTNWVVKHTPIDQSAILLSAGEAKASLREIGFGAIGAAYQMFFPPRLRFLRGVESLLHWLPLGGQYAVWGNKSLATSHQMEKAA